MHFDVVGQIRDIETFAAGRHIREYRRLVRIGPPGDTVVLLRWLLQAWTLAAFGEEMVFRGYLLYRIDLIGTTRLGWIGAILPGGVAFGIAPGYQGPAGVLTTGAIGCIMGLVYVFGGRNLWLVVISHGLVDTSGLLAIYFDQQWLLFP